MELISKLPNLETTIFSIMSALAKDYNAINLSQGFPDFDSDPLLIDLVTQAMKSGYNQYAPMAGVLELRERIAEKYDLLYKSVYNPETEITITSGATQAISCIIAAFIKNNDEVLICKPAYDCYEPFIELNGGKVIPVQLEFPKYEIDWNIVGQKINSKTKMIIINTPHNPSGRIFSKSDMLKLQELTKDTNMLVLSDEVYEHIIFDEEKHQSVCLFSGLKSRSFLVGSFGKTFHNTGWKIGYCCAPKELMDEFRKVHQFNVYCVNHPMQKALAMYLNEPSNYLGLPKFYQEKRDFFLDLIKPSRFKFTPSKGTYFQVLDYSEITQQSDVEYARLLAIKHGVASIPLSVFNINNLDNKVLRFCFAKTTETLKKAAYILNSI